VDRFPGARPAVARSRELLSPTTLARLETLQLGTRRRLAGAYAGEHRSPRRGSSSDFADYRDYHAGDDFRRIDYNLYARLGVLLIKLFESTDELNLHLLLDLSASMDGAKLEQSKRIAAAIGFVGLVNRDPVQVHTFPAATGAPRFLGRAAAPAFFGHLGGLRAAGATPLGAAAAALLARPGPPGLTVLVSDLLTPESDDALRRLPARGADLVVVHVLDATDLEPEVLGDVDLVDREDGTRVEVSITAEAASRFRTQAHAWADGIAAVCRRAGAAYLRVRSDEPIEPLLFTAWREAGVLR
jgi:uncharacterized protein (DUF58 family)